MDLALYTKPKLTDLLDPSRRPTELTQTSTTLYTLTSSGEVIVVTSIITTVVRPTGSATGTSGGGRSLNGDAGSSRSFFANTGAVAGTFAVVGLLAAGLVIGLAFFFLRRKKKRQLDEDIRVAAGGAGDGGAGKSRFAGDDDDDDPFAGGPGSDGHHSNSYHPPTMSSYGTVPLTAAAAAYAANGSGNRRASYNDGRRSMSSFDGGMQSQGSHPNIAGYNSATGGGAAAYAGYQAYGPGYSREERNGGGARSHEGALYPDWAEYVEGETTPPGRSSGEGSGSPQEGSGSAEGMSEFVSATSVIGADLYLSRSGIRRELLRPAFTHLQHSRLRLFSLPLRRPLYLGHASATRSRRDHLRRAIGSQYGSRQRGQPLADQLGRRERLLEKEGAEVCCRR